MSGATLDGRKNPYWWFGGCAAMMAIIFIGFFNLPDTWWAIGGTIVVGSFVGFFGAYKAGLFSE